MLTGMSLADVAYNDEIARGRPGQCFVTVGVHPYHAAELVDGGEEYLARLAESVDEALEQTPRRIAAFGELGLDYERVVHDERDVQLRAFRAQLEVFVERGWDLPLFLHCRGAFDDFVEVITPYVPRLPRLGLVHSFVGTVAQMQTLTGLGLDVSVNGFSFQSTESLRMVAAVPLDRLQLETDAPWGELKGGSAVVKRYCVNAGVMPGVKVKKRDKWEAGCMVKERNESCAMERVAFVVAGVRGGEVEEVVRRAWGNSVGMFGLGEGGDFGGREGVAET